MLATLVIGLREGLEASLIVGIIAAFLRRTGKPLRPMWIGVGIAIALSIAVGVILQLVSASLPQQAQEGMESIIGLVAVTFVTGMIGWMNQHARNMRSELETHAAEALKDGTAWALVAMAFLAVLKEGFETSVFLLAAFQSSTSVLAASAGAVIGLAISVLVGIGIYRGGVHLNLGRFFRITGIFLVFVAAGLVLLSFRTAHEAGWINLGQQQVLSLTWLAPTGSVQSALLTGVLGIPTDPRLIEVLGWFAYLIPMLAYLLWPLKRRPSGRGLAVFRVSLAAGFVVLGAVLAAAVALPSYEPSNTVTIVAADGTKGTATLKPGDDGTGAGKGSGASSGSSTGTSGSSSGTGTGTGTFTYSSTLDTGWGGGSLDTASIPTSYHDGVPTTAATWRISGGGTKLPASLTLAQLVTLNGGRLPIGVSAASNPGPFVAKSVTTSVTRVWTYGTGFVDASSSSVTVTTLTGGGLTSPRTVILSGAQTPAWRMDRAARAVAVDGITRAVQSASELMLWKLWIPIALMLAALALCGYVLRTWLRTRRTPPSAPRTTLAPKEKLA